MNHGIRGPLLGASLTLIFGLGLITVLGVERILKPQLLAKELEYLERDAALAEALLSQNGAYELQRVQDLLGPEVDVRLLSTQETPGDSPLRVVRPLKDGRRLQLLRDDNLIPGFYPLLALIGLAGIAAAMAMTRYASGLLRADLARLLAHTHALALGERRDPLELSASSELEGIAGSINKLSKELESSVGALAAQRDRFEAVLQAMSEGIVGLDKNSRVILSNPAAGRLFGLGADAVGQPLGEVVDIDELDELVEDAYEEGAGASEFPVQHEKTQLRVRVSATAQPDGGLVLVAHDVSEIRRLERLRRDFVANVSHELRTPVAIVKASAEALEDGALDDPEQSAHFLDAIQRNTTRLAALINDLLNLSRIEEGRYRFVFADLPLEERVQSVAGALRPRLRHRSQQLEVQIPAHLRVRADHSALEQILVNLLENAMKYTPEGGHIALGARVESGEVRLEVGDDGPGIEPQHRERLFERFYRVDPGRSRDVGGTGLGLAIVKHLAEAMSGSVGMEPNSPHGSVFWVRLPLVGIVSPASEEEETGG